MKTIHLFKQYIVWSLTWIFYGERKKETWRIIIGNVICWFKTLKLDCRKKKKQKKNKQKKKKKTTKNRHTHTQKETIHVLYNMSYGVLFIFLGYAVAIVVARAVVAVADISIIYQTG